MAVGGELIVRAAITARRCTSSSRDGCASQSRWAARRSSSRSRPGRLLRGDVTARVAPADADAVAIGETKLLVLNAGSLLVRLRRDPTFALEMLHRLSGRVRTLNAELEKALGTNGTDDSA